MLILVTYDVNTQDAAGRRRLNKIAKMCLKYGQRVQNSVFECLVEPHDYAFLQNELLKIADLTKDSLRSIIWVLNIVRKLNILELKPHMILRVF
jgi:CRISPR-associated protein Cas2